MSERDDILDDGHAGLRRSGGFSPQTTAAVARAARWSKYYLYLFAASILVGLVSQTVSAQVSAFGAAALAGNLVSYLFLLALFAYPTYHFYRFATLPEGGGYEEAVGALSSTLKYLGVGLVVLLGLYVGFIVIIAVIGVIAATAS